MTSVGQATRARGGSRLCIPARAAPRTLARSASFAPARFDSTGPLTVQEAQRLGLKVRSEIRPEVLLPMTLYPQPVRRHRSMEHLPPHRRVGRFTTPGGQA